MIVDDDDDDEDDSSMDLDEWVQDNKNEHRKNILT